MLKVKTKLGLSKIAGIGLIADEFIPKGTIVWEFNNKLDTYWSIDDINSLTESSKIQFHNYAYLDTVHNQYLLCGDDARFMNHSLTPNCVDSYNLSPDVTIASMDIQVGDEITCDYTSFYGNMDEHKEVL